MAEASGNAKQLVKALVGLCGDIWRSICGGANRLWRGYRWFWEESRVLTTLFHLFLVFFVLPIYIVAYDAHRDDDLRELARRIAAYSQHTRVIDRAPVKDECQGVNKRFCGVGQFTAQGTFRFRQEENIFILLREADDAGLSNEQIVAFLTVIEHESGFNELAKAWGSKNSAGGLCQLIRATGKSYGITDQNVFIAEKNAAACVQHFQDNYRKVVVPAFVEVEKRIGTVEGLELVQHLTKWSYRPHHDGASKKNPSYIADAMLTRNLEFMKLVYDEMLNRPGWFFRVSAPFRASCKIWADWVTVDVYGWLQSLGEWSRQTFSSTESEAT